MNSNIKNIYGLTNSSVAYRTGSKFSKGKTLIITGNSEAAERLASDISFFSKKEVLVFPEAEKSFIPYTAKNRDATYDFISNIIRLSKMEDYICVIPASLAMKPLVEHNCMGKNDISMKIGEEISLAGFISELIYMGYERVDSVYNKGQFTIRGGITDVFSCNYENPIRIEFFGDEVDSIRQYDIETGRSIEEIIKADIIQATMLPFSETLMSRGIKKIEELYNDQIKFITKKGDSSEITKNLHKRKEELIYFAETGNNLQFLGDIPHYFFDNPDTIFDYFEFDNLILADPIRIIESAKFYEEEGKRDLEIFLETGNAVPEDEMLIPNLSNITRQIGRQNTLIFSNFNIDKKEMFKNFSVKSQFADSNQIPTFHGNIDLLTNELIKYKDNAYKINIAVQNEGRKKGIEDILHKADINANVEVGNLSNGFLLPDEKLCYISDKEIFITTDRRKKRKKALKKRRNTKDFFDELKKEDYVVHENYGIGIYKGIITLTTEGINSDYIQINYAGSDVLYVPIEQMDKVQKYVGSGGKSPRVNKMTGTEWQTVKNKAKAAIADITNELIELYSERKSAKGFAFSKDTVWQKDFEDAFPFELTNDQKQAVEEIKLDMEAPIPMDRLLCGDVGFGKTEVAARAMFKALVDGKQVAFLVPTTILCRQHYITLKERFKNFPFSVAMLSRFVPEKEIEGIKNDLKNGKIDLIIGTHRILSKDLIFKDLGLLVVDEEQRFGVVHKEKIKAMKADMDVLTLSATPIPRTLNMSLSGIRDMSTLDEPPIDRKPVRTYVVEEDDIILRETIGREIARGGQAFVISDRIRGITALAERIRNLLPEATIGIGTGRMSTEMLEKVMDDFVEGRTNVLVSTTIIENGIDIPNANTIVIINSDRYGLSQLYQMRGRVGRSSREAYAYLTYKRGKTLNEIAEKRLRAVRDFTEFGSGFKIALKDLELRGAGNILGSEQSGHMMNIGYDLYCKLIEDAVKNPGKLNSSEEEKEIKINIIANLSISASYIENESEKLEIYKKIASIKNRYDYYDVIDEMTDRFGDPPRDCILIAKISLIRTMGLSLCVDEIYERHGYFFVKFSKKSELKGEKVIKAGEIFKGNLTIYAGENAKLKLKYDKKRGIDDLISLLETLLT